MNVEFELEPNDGGGALTFEWDAGKSSANLKKHGISFEEAATIFQDDVLTAEDTGSLGETREISFGRLGHDQGATVTVCVVHTERNGDTRIISARKATPHERKHFDAHIKKTHY